MDTLTHIVVGACIGEAIEGKVLGKKAMLLGAFAHSLPDVDFIAQLWLDATDGFLAHRGFTHSIVFGILATLVLTIIAIKIFPHRPLTRLRWISLFSINIFAHIFLDTFNAYGIGWFEPFSHERFSFHILYVADPFFSFWPFLAFLVLLLFNGTAKQRRIAWLTGIGLSAGYLLYAFFNKLSVDRDLRRSLKDQGIAWSRGSYIITPSPFNVWLWYVIVSDSSGYYIGYRSVFDQQRQTSLRHFARNDSLLNDVHNKDEVKDMLRFAGDFYTVERWNDTLVFNVLRFGQVVGWYDPSEKFTFYYFFDQPGANTMAVQRGRFERWNRTTFVAFVNRIMGN